MGGEASKPFPEDSLDIRVYHERQKNGSSGLQAINNLLQYAGTTQRDLDKIAKVMDKADSFSDQTPLRSPGKKTAFRYLTSVGKKNPRARNGNLSIQMMQKALKPFDVRLLATSDTELWGPDAVLAWGYVVQSGGNWSVMRQVGEHGLWMDLDSARSKPQLMSAEEVLRLQMGMPPNSGGQVFAVVGSPPPSPEKLGRRVVCLSVDPRIICTTRFNM